MVKNGLRVLDVHTIFRFNRIGARQAAVKHGAAHNIKRAVAREGRAPDHSDAAGRLRVGKAANAKQRIIRRNAIHC